MFLEIQMEAQFAEPIRIGLRFLRNVARSWCVAMHHIFVAGQNSKRVFSSVLNMLVLKGLNSFETVTHFNNI